jgi:Mor family transcriptional regulator
MTDPTADYLAGAASLAADPQRWPRQMAELTDLLADEALRTRPELGPELARALAGRQMARLAREFGGGNFYLPKGDALERALRDIRVWSDFDGTTDGPGGAETLARREGLSTIYVYRILAAQRDLHRARVQGDLFDQEDGRHD